MDLLAFGARHLALLVMWGVVFSMVSVLAGIPTAWWLSRRLRSTPAAARSRARTWCARLVIWVGCFMAPLVLAVFHAVPFAIERGLASGLDQSAPAAVGFVTDLAARRTMSMLAVRDEDAALDVRALKARVADALAAAQATRDAGSTWARVEVAAQTQFLAFVQHTLSGLTPANGLVTWREVAAGARPQADSGGARLFASLAVPLRAAAAGHAYSAAFLIGACNLVAVVLVRLFSRSAVSTPSESGFNA